jgi:hypothetical protein
MQTRNDHGGVVILVDRGEGRRWVQALAAQLTTSLHREVAIRAWPASHQGKGLPIVQARSILAGESAPPELRFSHSRSGTTTL